MGGPASVTPHTRLAFSLLARVSVCMLPFETASLTALLKEDERPSWPVSRHYLLFSWTTEDNHGKNSVITSTVPQIMRVYLNILPVTEEA